MVNPSFKEFHGLMIMLKIQLISWKQRMLKMNGGQGDNSGMKQGGLMKLRKSLVEVLKEKVKSTDGQVKDFTSIGTADDEKVVQMDDEKGVGLSKMESDSRRKQEERKKFQERRQKIEREY
ncbi:hypothetical protein Tco_0144746 [Tanacetum coccineum]